MPADDLAWLIDHVTRFNGGTDPVLSLRFLKCFRAESDRRNMLPVELLSLIVQYGEVVSSYVPDAVPLRE